MFTQLVDRRRFTRGAVVVNLPGAAGAMAADPVLRGSPENGGLLLGGLDHVACSHLNGNRRAREPFVDFVPVAAVKSGCAR